MAFPVLLIRKCRSKSVPFSIQGPTVTRLNARRRPRARAVSLTQASSVRH